MDPRELAIESAISDLSTNRFASIRATAKKYGVPESTLRGRLNGSTNIATSHQPQQRLTPEEEKFMVE